MGGQNIGDLLNAAGVTWGWFEGGFDLSKTNANGTTGCKRSTTSAVTGVTEVDYIPHHQPFQYYASTANATHARPTSVSTIGKDDAAHHQYDTEDFFAALRAGNLPAVSFVKAPGYQDGHAGYSDPLDEQAFVVKVINSLEQSRDWRSTAVFINYDDSDGWYDHQAAPLLNGSLSPADALTGPGACGQGTTPSLPGPDSNGQPVNGRCGPGVRTPLLVISPWARRNYVDHTLTTQASILLFIEQNWGLGKLGGGSFDATANPIDALFDFSQATPKNAAKLVLAPSTGLPQR
jgi:phospholipase C